MACIIDQTSNADKEICWARGDNDPKGFEIQDSKGIPVNISTWTLSMAVNTEKNPTDTVNEVFKIAGVFITDGTDGQVSFTPPANSLDSVIVAPATQLKAFYDINRITPSKKTIIKAVVLFIQDVDKT